MAQDFLKLHGPIKLARSTADCWKCNDCFNGVPVDIAPAGMRGEATFFNAIDRQEYSNGWRFLREDRGGLFYCGYDNQWLKEYAYRMDCTLSMRDAADFKIRIANFPFVAKFPPEWPHE